MRSHLNLGRLEILHKNRPRAGSKAINHQCRLCKLEIEPGSVYLLTRRKWKSIYTVKRFHVDCMPAWFSYMLDYMERREVREAEAMVKRSRNSYVELKPDITPEEVIERRKLQIRKSYVIRRLRLEFDMPTETRVRLREELVSIESRIHSFGQYNEKWSVHPTEYGLTLKSEWG